MTTCKTCGHDGEAIRKLTREVMAEHDELKARVETLEETIRTAVKDMKARNYGGCKVFEDLEAALQ